MRGFALIASFLILLVALWGLWQHRFERVEGAPTWHLEESPGELPAGVSVTKDPVVMALRRQPGGAPIVCRMGFSSHSPVDFLHLKLRIAAKDLVPGAERWADGRCIIEWQSPEGHAVEMDPVSSVQGDQDTGLDEIVMRPEHPPAIPVLRLENLGLSGTLELREIQAVPLQESAVWKIGRCVLVLAGFVWVFALARLLNPRVNRASAALAAALSLAMWIAAVVPGPWKQVLPLVSPFAISERSSAPMRALEFPQANSSTATASAGKIPDKGDITLRLKHQVESLRTLLHILMLAGPVFLISLAAGKRPAWLLGGILSLAIEAAQVAYGYNFDWLDVMDLVCDAAGILLALGIHSWLCRRWSVRSGCLAGAVER